MLKRGSPDVFYRALERIGASPSETLFIDDNPRNLAVAKLAGIEHVHRFTDANSLRKSLKEEFGIKI